MGGLNWEKIRKNLTACNGAKRWLYHVSIATDQWFNALFGGEADETISSRAYRHVAFVAKPKKRWQVVFRLIEGLFFWEKNHCRTAYESELNRKQYPEAFREKNDAA